jgi:hypothetical protein
MISTYKKGNYRKLQFNGYNQSTEMVITSGLVVLDNARLSSCNLNDIVVQLSYKEDNSDIIVKKPLKQFINTQTEDGYNVDFLRNVTVSCWVNITQPTRLKIDISGMGHGIIYLEYFVLKLS